MERGTPPVCPRPAQRLGIVVGSVALFLMFSAMSPAASPAAVTFAPEHLDAGSVFAGQTLVRQFHLVNHGPAAVTIIDIRASCGCAAPTIDRRTLAPGERAVVTLDVNTLSQPAGSVRWSVTVEWEAGGGRGRSSAQLTARLEREIVVEPAAVSLAGDAGLSGEIRLIDPRSTPLAITGIRADRGFVRAEIRPDRRVAVSIADACPSGVAVETLRIATNDPRYPELRVPITLHRRSAARVVALPGRVILTPDASVLVQVRGRDGEPIRIESLESSHRAVSTRWAPGPGSFATIRVSLDRSQWDKCAGAGEIRVRLASPPGESLVVPVLIRVDE